MSVLELLAEIRALPIEARKELMKLMIDTFTDSQASDATVSTHSLRELRGLGKDI